VRRLRCGCRRDDRARRRPARRRVASRRSRLGDVRLERRRRRALPGAAREPGAGRLSPPARRGRGSRDRRRATERCDRTGGPRRCRGRSHRPDSQGDGPLAGGHRGGVGPRPRSGRDPCGSQRRARSSGGDDGRARARLPVVCPCVRSTPPGPLFVQLAARSVRRVPGVRSGHRDQLGQGRPGPPQVAPRRGHQAVERSEHLLGARDPREVLHQAAHPDGSTVAGTERYRARARRRRRGVLGAGEIPGGPGMVCLAGDANVQDARPRSPVAVPRVCALPVVPRRSPEHDGARVSCGGIEPGRLARADRRRRPRTRAGVHRARSAGPTRPGNARVPSRLPGPGRPRLSHAGPAGPHPVGGRGAARELDDGARGRPHGNSLRDRRADGGPARIRRPGPLAGDARSGTRWKYGGRRRARPRDRARVRSGRRDGAGRGTPRGSCLVRRDAERTGPARRPADRPGVGERAARAARTAADFHVARGPGGARAQPGRRRRSFSAGCALRRHRPEWLGQVDAGARRSVPGDRARPGRLDGAQAGPTRLACRRRWPRPRDPRRSVSPRPHRPRQRGDLRQGVGSSPRALRERARVDPARTHAGPLLVQRRGGQVRGMRRRGLRNGRDAVSRRRAARLRRLPWPSLQARGAGGQAPWLLDRGRSRDDRGPGMRAVRSTGCARLRLLQGARPRRPGGTRVSAARSAALDAVRRRSPAAEACARSLRDGEGYAVRHRRAERRSPCRGRGVRRRRPACARRRRGERRRRRARSRRDPRMRLGDRPGSRRGA
jgi:hypothetical protein